MEDTMLSRNHPNMIPLYKMTVFRNNDGISFSKLIVGAGSYLGPLNDPGLGEALGGVGLATPLLCLWPLGGGWFGGIPGPVVLNIIQQMSR